MKTKKVAKKIEKMGRKGDTILAHINKDEAHMLKAMGGSGKKHPKTGLLEFNNNDPEGNADAGFTGGDSYGGGGFGGGLDAFAGYGGMLGGVQPSVEEPNGGFGTAATEVRGFTPGVDMQNRNLFGQMVDMYQGLSPQQRTGVGMVSPVLGGLGSLGSYLDRQFGLGWSGGSMGTQASAGNGFDGGNLPNDGATTPVVPTTGTGTGGTTTGLPITPPNWGNYGPSPFTYKFGQPRNMAGLLNFGG